VFGRWTQILFGNKSAFSGKRKNLLGVISVLVKCDAASLGRVVAVNIGLNGGDSIFFRLPQRVVHFVQLANEDIYFFGKRSLPQCSSQIGC
jgi:hypothetical protein